MNLKRRSGDEMVAIMPRFQLAVSLFLTLVAPVVLAQRKAPTQRSLQTTERSVAARAATGLTENSGYYKRWINQDVHWIITDEELAAWKKLTTNWERDLFIDAFWARRDPTPDTVENEYKDEHYRRVLYANERFGAGIPGWRTDRGHVYILYGKPDAVDAHPKGGSYQRPAEEGGGHTDTYAFEVWRYRYLEGIGTDIEIEFVDACGCGEYQMTLDRSVNGPMVHVPKVVSPETESMRTTQADRFRGANKLDRLDVIVKPGRAPELKFKDLEAALHTKIHNQLPFDVRVDFVRVTTDTVLVPITIQVPNSALKFIEKDGVQRASINIFARFEKITGQTVSPFEDTLRLDVPPELLSKVMSNVAMYWRALPMPPGIYRLDVVLKDVNGDKLGVWRHGVVVPDFEQDKLAHSTLIVADLLESVPSPEVGAGSFVLGSTKVRPKVPPDNGKPVVFKRDLNRNVNFWMQVYNLSIDAKTRKPSATVEYQIVNASNNQTVVDFREKTETMENVSDQLTLQKSVPTDKLNPGIYQITIKVTDLLTKETISPAVNFAVE
jgi:GWxTD domain-containing protein